MSMKDTDWLAIHYEAEDQIEAVQSKIPRNNLPSAGIIDVKTGKVIDADVIGKCE